MTNDLEAYRQGRETLLAVLIESLSKDERVVAAWLTGSYGRDEADAVSDIDLTVVIADAYSESLCQRMEMTTAWPPAERLTFFSRFGEPVNVHENNHNAPQGGTFTSVLYWPSAHLVDWILVPHAQARRPADSRLLFERISIPDAAPPPPPDPATLPAQVAEWVAFFWMMSAVAARYLVRRDLGLVRCWLDELGLLVRRVERSLNGQAYEYHRSLVRPLPLSPSWEDLKAALISLGDDMEAQMAAAGRMDIPLRPPPRAAIATLLQLRH